MPATIHRQVTECTQLLACAVCGRVQCTQLLPCVRCGRLALPESHSATCLCCVVGCYVPHTTDQKCVCVFQVIYKDEVDLPDQMGSKEVVCLEYPPLIKVRAQISSEEQFFATGCSVKVNGLDKDIIFELMLNGKLQRTMSTPCTPFSPPFSPPFSLPFSPSTHYSSLDSKIKPSKPRRLQREREREREREHCQCDT